MNEIAGKWEVINTDSEDIKQSISLIKKTTRNMYLCDIQFKIWYDRVATRYILYRMNITEDENCALCQELETSVHAFAICERAQIFWREIKQYLLRLGYRNFRLKHKVIILGNNEMDGLFNFVLMIGKIIIYKKK